MKKIYYYIVSLTFLILLGACSDESASLFAPDYLTPIDASKLPSGNRPMTMFEDSESSSKMYDNKDRWFYVAQPMQVILSGKDSVQISLYSPIGLSNVKVYAKLADRSDRFLIYNFSEIPPFHRSFHQIPIASGNNNYQLENGKIITIDKIADLSNQKIEFSVESTDPLFKKFKKIKSKRIAQFNDKYHKSEYGKYLPMNPVLAKEAITMIINFSYAISHPLYYETFMNFDRYKMEQAKQASSEITGALNWHGNGVDVAGVYDYLSQEEIQQAYNKYIDSRVIDMAMVGGENAWGGGALVSHWESDYVTGHWLGNMSVWSHEYSHHSGYSHTSNLCYYDDGGGQQEMFANFYKYLIYINDLPFTDPDLLKGYTKKDYLNQDYQKPIFKINKNNPFLIKYNGQGRWD